MRGDRRALSATELSQLERCEQQILFDRRFGEKRSDAWRARAAEGRVVHERLHRDVSAPGRKRGRHRMVIALVLAALLAALLFLTSARGGQHDHDALLPPELAGARLVMSEKSIVRTKPVHVSGRPDEVWEKGGRRFIVETKSRGGRVFAADRMQLAAYAYMLRADGGPALAPHGYIRFTGGGEPRFERVPLAGDDAVVRAHRRYNALLAGGSDPASSQHAALCRGCGHLARCPSAKTV